MHDFWYKLQDYWETPMWNVTDMLDTEPPTYVHTQLGLWELGNEITACAAHTATRHIFSENSHSQP